MLIVFRWLIRIAAVLIAFTVLAVLGVYYLASRSLPDYDKSLEVAELSAPLRILRDHSNIPHIFASEPEKGDEPVYFGLGYAHAQDRLWQMTLLRRTAQGRLSEVFGASTLPIDKLLRRFDIYTLARSSVAAQDPETLAALEAYAAGVNARLAEINDSALGRGAPEMFLFNAPISPWRPEDSLAILKLMAVQLSGQAADEVLRARTALLLDNEDRLKDILPDVPGTGVAALPEYASLFPTATFPSQFAANNEADITRHPLSPLKNRAFAGASNAWAAAPSRSATAGTLLANDPHLGLTAPAIWYLARLELETGGVIGATIPGMPIVLAGRSESLGWGLTSSYLDDQDIFMEELNPANNEEYRTPDGYKAFETRRSIIKIKDAAPVTLIMRSTDNGLVLPPSFHNVSAVTPSGHVASLGWTALEPADTSMSAAFHLMRAQNIDEALGASALYIAPSQNLTLADKDNIALKTIGAMPRRDANAEGQGRIPARGWLTQNRWQGVFPASANPEFIRPAGGIVGNTNNKLLERPFPLHVSYSWGDTQRILRWQRLMQGRKAHTRDSFVEAQLDTVSYTARTLLPLVAADLWFTGEAAAEGTPERRRQIALNLLAGWNGNMNEHLPEPLIYSAWMRFLQERLIRDELGPLAEEYIHMEPLFVERVFRNIDGAGVWCNIIQSSATESCTDIARLALDDALVWLDETYGTSIEALRWGDAHEATHDHAVLGEVPILRYFVNIRQSTSGGDNTLMRGRTSGTSPYPFQNVHAAGYRGVYDFTDPDSSVFILSTGQSGHPLSRHYDDMAQLWRRGEYITMSLDEGLARAASVGETLLIPKTD
ncbi:penicillin acylase family protein [Lentibacter sp. XHP0401]|jgi:penicillin G amidase|uniref:penicillin acylase family protein n=1 Tax=Lentibacter sp. XHP0401 TaxID=2984334 RepID=UPI0021E78CE3|nr:penicillin acylase family protein [Lentibacter sp. XHP0401]MCV2892342.1 penicillin acylase family protein [Lentibacter sp. XHP0401]